MRLGLNLSYWTRSSRTDIDMVIEAERLGYDSVWAAEAYGSDAVTVLSWLGASTSRIKLGAGIFQIPGRSPAMTAMTAATLDELSGGRFLLGLGVSGPQVAEGWHGVPYGRPLARTREYVEIVRRVLARDGPVSYEGDYYQIPYEGSDATGLGKPLKLIMQPKRSDLPIYLAAMGPRNVALAAEIADGWLPFFYSPDHAGLFRPALAEGFARSGEADKEARFDVAAGAVVGVTDDLDSARSHVKPTVALYVGGMGSPERNFYWDLAVRYGYEQAARQIQDLYLTGRKEEAASAVPDALVDQTNLLGPAEAVGDRLAAWSESGVTTLLVTPLDVDSLRLLPDLMP
ncbi:MAG: LLM class F420-dependent oxidoreductase [Acidimicrobiia bacterium]